MASLPRPRHPGSPVRRRRIPTPENVGSDLVYISNYAAFHDVRVFPIAADELYDWSLLAGPSGDRPVWIRFSNDPDAAVGRATIVLDQELPTLKPTPNRVVYVRVVDRVGNISDWYRVVTRR